MRGGTGERRNITGGSCSGTASGAVKVYPEVQNYLMSNSEYIDFNSRVPKTVRHGTSLHRICPKLLIDSSPIHLKSIDSSPS